MVRAWEYATLTNKKLINKLKAMLGIVRERLKRGAGTIENRVIYNEFYVEKSDLKTIDVLID